MGAAAPGRRGAAQVLWAAAVLGTALPEAAEAALVEAVVARAGSADAEPEEAGPDRAAARYAAWAAEAAVASGRGWAAYRGLDEGAVQAALGPAGVEAVRLGRARMAARHAHNGGGGGGGVRSRAVAAGKCEK
jgi:hypothetical protein